MKFVDSAKNELELRNCISYEVLKPIFEWLKRQKWHDVFCDASLSEDYDSPRNETVIGIRRSFIYKQFQGVKEWFAHPDPRHSVCCIITYSPGETVIHLENWVQYWDYSRPASSNTIAAFNSQYVDIPIGHPNMFKILKEYLINVQNSLLLEQDQFTEDVKAATNNNEIPNQSKSDS